MAPEPDGSITRLLAAAREGDEHAANEVYLLVYNELHRVAAQLLRGANPGHTLQATALVNEAYLRVFKGQWHDRAHFLAVAARAMRSVIVDHARAKRSGKRSPPGQRLALEELTTAYEQRSLDLVALDQALAKLAAFDPHLVRLVELRFFGGLAMPEVAEVLGLPLRTLEREWNTARAWLRKELA